MEGRKAKTGLSLGTMRMRSSLSSLSWFTLLRSASGTNRLQPTMGVCHVHALSPVAQTLILRRLCNSLASCLSCVRLDLLSSKLRSLCRTMAKHPSRHPSPRKTRPEQKMLSSRIFAMQIDTQVGFIVAMPSHSTRIWCTLTDAIMTGKLLARLHKIELILAHKRSQSAYGLDDVNHEKTTRRLQIGTRYHS